MDRVQHLRGTPTFQLWWHYWQGQDLFAKTLLADFFNPLILGRETEGDFQLFADDRPTALTFDEIPKNPIRAELSYYLFITEFPNPVIGIPPPQGIFIDLPMSRMRHITKFFFPLV